jgi:hypothetical protein
VRNSLETIDGPDGSAEQVEVHAQTSAGDILVGRSAVTS